MSDNEILSMLEIKRTYNASQETVFDALTKPEIMAKWFYGMQVLRAGLLLRTGRISDF